MASLNKVFLIGNVGQEPEIRVTPSGAQVARFSMATNERWTSRASGEQQEHTEWHNVVAFGRLAEQVKEYVSKGRQLFVEGRIRTNSWTDVNGVKHTRTEIHANQIVFLGSRGAAAEGGASRTARQVEKGGDIDIDEDFTVGDLGPAVEMDDLSLNPND
ncbi:MAG: hypothetical protein B1H03_04470 [Planctomycetales bacterium 4484_113]|nr:MAG: hypothetical protein B1H03_04470 [Planctomycetales bacterium 4484_113]